MPWEDWRRLEEVLSLVLISSSLLLLMRLACVRLEIGRLRERGDVSMSIVELVALSKTYHDGFDIERSHNNTYRSMTTCIFEVWLLV